MKKSLHDERAYQTQFCNVKALAGCSQGTYMLKGGGSIHASRELEILINQNSPFHWPLFLDKASIHLSLIIIRARAPIIVSFSERVTCWAGGSIQVSCRINS